MKTKEELNTLKEEAEALNEKLHELTVEELEQVNGGIKLDPERFRKKVEEAYLAKEKYNLARRSNIMAKTKEELNALKKEAEAPNKKLCELTDEELEQVAGGTPSEDSGTRPHPTT